METGFENKVAIITGAGQGIGLEICRLLTSRGANVVLNDLSPALSKNAAESIGGKNGMCIPVSGNAADLETIENLIDTAISKFGKLDIAIANAGITVFGEFISYSLKDFQTVIQTNLQAAFFMTQKASAKIKEQRTGGSILLMSSVTAHQAHQNLSAYSMSKAAIEMLAKNLVLDLSPFGIRINALAPGATLTERTLKDENYKSTWGKITPLGKAATVTDVAEAALFLVSNKANHITGQTLIVDGGWTSVSPSPF